MSRKKLSEKEKIRLEKFNIIRDQMKEDGYREKLLTINMKKANILVFLTILPVIIPVNLIYFYVNNERGSLGDFSLKGWLMFLVLYVLFILIHELVHGITWALVSKKGFDVIEFGIMWEHMAPYCTCKVPLEKKDYLIGALAPLVVVGILPTIIGILIGSYLLTTLGAFLVIGAIGDILITKKILDYRPGENFLIYDHPTEAGSIVFEKN